MTDASKLYVGNLSSKTDSRDIEDAFSRFGRIRSVEMKRRYAFVDFAHKSDAESAISSMDGKEIDGSKLLVEWTKGQAKGPGSRRNPPRRFGDRRRTGRSGRRPPERSDYRIAVSNLPDRCHWSELKDHFRQAGPVVFGDVWGTRGVIEFKYKVDMEYAIKEYDGVKWKGYALSVEKDLRARKSRSRSRDRGRRERKRSRSRSDSRSRSKSRSYSHSRSASRDKKIKNRSPSRSPKRSKSPKSRSPQKSRSPKISRSPKRSLSPKSKEGSRSPERKNNAPKEAEKTEFNDIDVARRGDGDEFEEKVEKISGGPSPDRQSRDKKRKHNRSRSSSNGRENKRGRRSQERSNDNSTSPKPRNSSRNDPEKLNSENNLPDQ